MTPEHSSPSLAAFERLIANGELPRALRMAFGILDLVDAGFGRVDDLIAEASSSDAGRAGSALIFATRFAASLGRLLTAPELQINMVDYQRLSAQHKWIDLLFSLSGFRTSDSFIQLIGKPVGDGRLHFAGDDFRRLLLLLGADTLIKVDFDRFWAADRPAAAAAFLNYLGSRYVFAPRAFAFRERLLEWLPERLGEVRLDAMSLSRVHEFFAHCSYACTPRKHAIKRPLMEQMRRACLEAGVVEVAARTHTPAGERPTIVVVLERFLPGHAIFRTHSRAIAALRERFKLVGVVPDDRPGGMPIGEFFDECLVFPRMEFFAAIRTLAGEIAARQPALIFYPSVGMAPQVIALAALRLAPIQCASYGHMATTMSPAMDYIIFPEDFVGAAHCFSERILALPKTAMPFVPAPAVKVERRQPDGIVRVAIPASIMKLNPLLFDAVARIAAGAKARVVFQFFPLAARGLAFTELARVVRERIPRAAVFPELPHPRYVERLGQCDLFLCPFPYGNTNSIVDAFQLGLPGICLDGEEAHAHTDAALFARIGQPEELVTGSVDEYVAAAIKMIDDAAWREHCSAIVRNADLDVAFFSGEPTQFAAAIEKLISASAAEPAAGLSK